MFDPNLFIPTGKVIGQFRHDLQDAGIEGELLEEIVRDTAHALVRGETSEFGLVVSKDDDSAVTA